ncbi:MAG: histidine phosphatase family protein [Pseudomonadota bacterium]
MRTLVLLRHAKSSWSIPGADDFERPLNERGRFSAPQMGLWLSKTGINPDHVLCSPAIRTVETYERLKASLGNQATFERVEDLYLAGTTTILNACKTIPSDTQTVMVIGHNPGLHETALKLLTTEERSASGALRAKFPTAACAVIGLAIDTWADLTWDIGQLKAYMEPRSLVAINH